MTANQPSTAPYVHDVAFTFLGEGSNPLGQAFAFKEVLESLREMKFDLLASQFRWAFIPEGRVRITIDVDEAAVRNIRYKFGAPGRRAISQGFNDALAYAELHPDVEIVWAAAPTDR